MKTSSQTSPQNSPGAIKKIAGALSIIATILSGITLVWTQTRVLQNLGEQLGLVANPVSIAGTGSMAPTFALGAGKTPEERAQETVATVQMWRYPGGLQISDFRLGQYNLQYGDLVFVRDSRANNVVGTNGLLKRVIAVAGDTIELRDGFVWRNGERLVEPYTLQPRSTFGGTSTAECTNITVPENSIFILGDNRKQSDDSRFRLGFVPLSSVQRYLPWKKQLGVLDSNWRTNAENDVNLAGTISLDTTEFLTLINAQRKAQNIAPLNTNSALSRLAQKRAEQWLGPTPPATSSTALLAAANQAGYINPLLAELPVSGFYTSEELLATTEEVSAWSDILMRSEYDDIGVAVKLGTGDCPKQSIVIFLGGYKPADYNPSMVTSWEAALNKLREVKPGWDELLGNSALSDEQKKNLQELVGIIDTRLTRVESLVRTMQRREWFSKEQELWLTEDAALAEKQFSLSTKLNSQ